MASAATLSVALLFVPATAGAFVHGTFGLQQRKPVFLRNGPLQYHAGPVIHASDSYAIYWDPLELYNPRWMTMIDEYFQNVGSASGQGGNVFAMNAQYGGLRHREPAADDGLVANLVRSSSTHAVLRAVAPRRLVLLLASAALTCAAMLCAVAPAGAVVVPIEGGKAWDFSRTVPRLLRTATSELPRASQIRAATPCCTRTRRMRSTGIRKTPTTAIGSISSTRFLQGSVAKAELSSNVFAVDAQYTDKSNTPASYASTFMGAYTDTNPVPRPPVAQTPTRWRQATQ